MKELYIIRHGPAGKQMEDASLDESRPLTKKGAEKMTEASKGMKKLGIRFDKIVTSPLIRAEESADILRKYCADKGDVEATDLLRPGFAFEELVGFLNALEGMDRVAIVGHEPSLSEFAAYCLVKGKSSFIDLKKGGIMMLEADGKIRPGKCKLSWLLTPSQLIVLC